MRHSAPHSGAAVVMSDLHLGYVFIFILFLFFILFPFFREGGGNQKHLVLVGLRYGRWLPDELSLSCPLSRGEGFWG
jgi:hypothetical protein